MDRSLPQGFTERIKKDLGNDAESFLRSFFDVPKRGLRINTLKVNDDAEAKITNGLKNIPWEVHGYYYDMGDAPGRSPFHAAGAYYIQEPSAMAPVNFLDVRPGMCVLDLCASPGGKSTQIASRLKGSGLLTANEIVPDRARILSQNIERMGITNAILTSHDPGELSDRFPAAFDRILVDAPCSGEGMFRRDDTAIQEWSEENVSMCAKRQAMILDKASVMLKPGGRLVYSTCTFSKEEDEGQITDFLERHSDFRLLKVSPSEGMREEDGMIRILPQDGFGEGHFMAVVEREGELDAASWGYHGAKASPLNNKQKSLIKPYMDFVSSVMKEGALRVHITDPSKLSIFGKNLYAIPDSGIPELAGLRVIRAGLELGEIRKERFKPSHALALAMKPEDAVCTVELDDSPDEAGRYLRGESLTQKDPAAGYTGWTLVTVSGISLGWAKASNGMLKNHYPKGLRSY